LLQREPAVRRPEHKPGGLLFAVLRRPVGLAPERGRTARRVGIRGPLELPQLRRRRSVAAAEDALLRGWWRALLQRTAHDDARHTERLGLACFELTTHDSGRVR